MIIAIVILFLLFLAYFYSFYPQDKYNWLRALILAVGLELLSLLPNVAGIGGWIIAFILAILLIMKVASKTFGGAFLFLIVVGIIMQVVAVSLTQFIH